MSKRTLRIRSIDCPRTQDDSKLTFNVALHEPCETRTPVQLAISGASATNQGSAKDYGGQCQVSFNSGRNYEPLTSSTVQVPAGACGFKVRVDPVAHDTAPVETTVNLVATHNGVVSQGSGSSCNPITPPVGVRSVSCAQQVEGEALIFNVALSGSAGTPTRVQLNVSDGSAQAGSDYSTALQVSFDNGKSYVAVTGSSIDVPAGACAFKVRVATIDDSSVEASENLCLRACANGSSASGTGTILDNDLQPAKVACVSSTHASEGDALVFNVNLCPAGTKPTTVNLLLSNGTALAGQDFDATGLEVSFDGGRTFVPIAGPAVSVPAGASCFQVKVPGIEDAVHEPTESFTLRASTDTSSAQGIGTICDDDSAIKLVSVNSTHAPEGAALTFAVALSGAASAPTTVQLQLTNGTAMAGQDFATSGLQVSFDGGKTFTAIAASSVTVPAGVSGFQVKVAGIDDSVYEGDEAFTLQAATNGSSAQGIGTICENDSAIAVTGVSSAAANEGDSLTFSVTLSATSSTATTVQLQLANGTASAGQDFATTGLQVSFDGGNTFALITGTSVSVPAGISGFQVKVPGIDDAVYEGNEQFTLQASSNGSSAVGLGTICENDRYFDPNAIKVVGDTQILEGSPAHVFSIKLGEVVTSDTWVTVKINDGSAHRTDVDGSGQDYVKDAATQSAWKAILPTATAGVDSLNKDFGVYDTAGTLISGDTIRVLVHAGSSESETFSVKTWQELQRVSQLGSAYEGDEQFRIEVAQVGSQTFTQPAASTVTICDAHIQQISPIIIDLNGDGVRTVSIEQSQARFDMDLDGVRDATGWVSREDGLLAVDVNHDGRINDRSELFGGDIGQGFSQLAAFDSNQDGVVNASDERFADLQIWQDRDGDGATDTGELVRLDQAGIASLRVSYEMQHEEQNGNMLLERSSAQFADGHISEMADAYFTVQSGVTAPRLADLLVDHRDEEIPLGNLASTPSIGRPGNEVSAAMPQPIDSAYDGSVDLEHLLHKAQASGD